MEWTFEAGLARLEARQDISDIVVTQLKEAWQEAWKLYSVQPVSERPQTIALGDGDGITTETFHFAEGKALFVKHSPPRSPYADLLDQPTWVWWTVALSLGLTLFTLSRKIL